MPEATTVAVRGMTCGHCVQAVTNELLMLDETAAVDVDLDSGWVTVTSDRPLDTDTVRAAVIRAGYDTA